ncbi:MAG: hypothetical protein RR011_02095 [Oscillospiraceae bacterium]
MATNRFQKKNGFSVGKSIALPILTVAVSVFLLWNTTEKISRTTETQQQKSIEKAIVQGAVHCYATQGSYPQDVQYLKEHYGLHYDEDKYFVDYSIFASNIMPEITVIKIE